MSKEFAENRGGVHLMNGEFTLCGYSIDIEALLEDDNDGNPVPTNKKVVTCKECKEIIRMCRGTRIGNRE